VPAPSDLVESARRGDRRSLARLVSLVEDLAPEGREAIAAVHDAGDRGWVTGITGAPGAGKSVLVSALIGAIRSRGREVAVVAVDPSSPFTGGAILGDRIRMQHHIDDSGVFIRSMANRGTLGGIAGSTPLVVALLDGLGFPEIVIETVGVGQAEVAIASEADTTAVVVNPGWGDSVQAAKAGLLEIADVLVVNKADRPGADDAQRELLAMLQLGGPRPWSPPVVMTSATEGSGIAELWEAIEEHRAHLEVSGELVARRAARTASTEQALADE